MQENRRQYPQDASERSGTVHIWVIGAIVALALLLAWVAFNRSGQDVIPTAIEGAADAAVEVEGAANTAADAVSDVASDAVANARFAAARAEARTELLAVQAELEAGVAYDEVTDDLNEIEASLEAAYANTSEDMQIEYQKLQQEFSALSDSLQDGTGDALEAMAGILLMLEAEVRSGT